MRSCVASMRPAPSFAFPPRTWFACAMKAFPTDSSASCSTPTRAPPRPSNAAGTQSLAPVSPSGSGPVLGTISSDANNQRAIPPYSPQRLVRINACVFPGVRLETLCERWRFPHWGARFGQWLQRGSDFRGVRTREDTRARGVGTDGCRRRVYPGAGAKARDRNAFYRPEPVQDEVGTGVGRTGGA